MTRKIKLTIPEGVENHFKKWAVVHTQWENKFGVVTKIRKGFVTGEVNMTLKPLSRWRLIRWVQVKLIRYGK